MCQCPILTVIKKTVSGQGFQLVYRKLNLELSLRGHGYYPLVQDVVEPLR